MWGAGSMGTTSITVEAKQGSGAEEANFRWSGRVVETILIFQ